MNIVPKSNEGDIVPTTIDTILFPSIDEETGKIVNDEWNNNENQQMEIDFNVANTSNAIVDD